MQSLLIAKTGNRFQNKSTALKNYFFRIIENNAAVDHIKAFIFNDYETKACALLTEI